MGKTVILSEDTLRQLLEAHASLSAWYYQLSAALASAGISATTPDDPTRASFVEGIGKTFPEVQHIAATITVPRSFVPLPPRIAPPASPEGADKDRQT